MKRKISKIFWFEIVLYINTIFFLFLDIFLILVFKKIDIENEPDFPYSTFFSIWGIWVIMFLTISIFLLLDAIKLIEKKDNKLLLDNMKRIKYLSIPYFVLNFILSGGLTYFINAISHGFGIFIIPIPFLLTYCVLIPTAFYGIGLLLVLYQEEKINIKIFLIYVIFLLCFLIDIIAVVLLEIGRASCRERV